MFIAGRYRIDDEYKVHNIITKDNPNGNFVYDPFVSKEVLPFWGVMCTTFWGLNEENRDYLINTIDEDKLQEIQFNKFWIFWFSDGDLNEQKELFFYGNAAKENAYTVQQIFNHLLEKQIDKLLIKTREEFFTQMNIGGLSKDIDAQLRSQKI